MLTVDAPFQQVQVRQWSKHGLNIAIVILGIANAQIKPPVLLFLVRSTKTQRKTKQSWPRLKPVSDDDAQIALTVGKRSNVNEYNR